MNNSHSLSEAEGSGAEASTSTFSPKSTKEGPSETDVDEALKRRARRRRNRKKLVLHQNEPKESKPEEKIVSELVLNPTALPAPTQTVTFKETEIRPIAEGKIYVQRDHSFIPVSQDIFFLSSTQNLLEQTNPISASPESIAEEYQRRFVPLATFCHGLLAGMALWQSITEGNTKELNNIEASDGAHVHTARTFQILFYILVAVSSVAVLDWCIPSNKNTWNDFRKHLALQPLSLFALLASFGSIVTWGLTAQLDDIKAAYFQNGTSLFSAQDNQIELSEQWRTLNLIRCVLAGISFLLTAVSQTHTYELKHFIENGIA